MPLNNNALTALATTLQTILAFAQLHSGPAGMGAMNNVALPGRQAAHWGAPANAFGLISAINFAGGLILAGTPAYSVTLWDAETETGSSHCFGEFVLSADTNFDLLGNFSVTAIDLTGTASGA